MKKLKQFLLIIFIACFITQCSAPDFTGCYTCKKRSGGYNTSGGYVTTYDATLACSDEAAESMESKGWDCIRTESNLATNGPGKRTVDALSPGNGEVNVSLTDSLGWSKHINWYNDEYIALDGVTYDVYFGTEPNPTIIVSKSQTKCSYVPVLENSKTYYWKITAKNQSGETSTSFVSGFKTRPVTTFGTFTDNRDGHSYKTVNIVEQRWMVADTTIIWMAENLAYEIPGKQISDATSWSNNTAFNGWCYYNNDKNTYGSIYGILYQWEASKAVCPPGWHLPSQAEWDNLVGINGIFSTGGKLKEAGTVHWASPNVGATNESGFTALPGGLRDKNGIFKEIGMSGSWWADPVFSYNLLWEYVLRNDVSSILLSGGNKNYGSSVRCIKN